MFWTVTQSLISGLGTATQLFALTLLFGLPLGLVIAFGSMSKWRPLKAVVDVIVWIIRGTLLQMIKRIVTTLSTEIITLVKDTSLARIIAITELIKAGESYMKSAGIIWPLFYTGLFYLVFVGILTIVFNLIERKLSYFR